MANNKEFSVMDMLDDYAAGSELDPKEVFKRHPVSGNIARESQEPAAEAPGEASISEAPKKAKKEWRPDPSLTEGMKELQSTGVVYDKKDIVFQEDKTLVNNADEAAIQESRESMNNMERSLENIEEAKRRHGFSKLQIPDGEFKVRVMIAANDTNHKRSQDKLDELFEEMKETYPIFILEWLPGYGPEPEMPPEDKFHQNTGKVTEFPSVSESENSGDDADSYEAIGATTETPTQPLRAKMQAGTEAMEAGATIIVDKRSLPSISWSQEEVEKIKKSRTIELNIVEGADLEFGSIQDVKGNAVDAVLSQYQRKTNDVVAALPASKYRATFSGLTYPEVIDLSSSNEMNTLDGERKKWSICFNHIHNPSIGPWEEYVLYRDPDTNRMVKIDVGAEVPSNVPEDDVHLVSKFEDFLRKTSFLDLEFMLWKILCATAMDKEVISIDCHNKLPGGTPCNNSYDWIYSPAELLSTDSISPTVLEEMRQTGEASTTQEIMKNYNTSPVRSNDYVKLHTSGFMPIYGHISAFEYLDEVYSKIKELDDAANENDPTIVSRSMSYTTLTTIKAFLIPTADGLKRITGADDLVKVLSTLDEIDWQTITEITRLMLEPYQFRFSMRDIVCPKCKNKSVIPIDSMSRLLFIVARSLSSVNVTLTRT